MTDDLLTTAKHEELALIGDLQLPRVGRIIRVRLMYDATYGIGVDVREFVLPSFWDRVNEARGRAAAKGKKLYGPTREQQFVGPMKRGWTLQPSKADELSELLVTAIVKAEAMQAEEPTNGPVVLDEP